MSSPASRIDPEWRGRRPNAALLAALTWLALLVQFGIYLPSGPGYAITKFLTFFTILTNLLVALVCTAFARRRLATALRFFARPSVAGAAASYIVIVSIVYNILLRGNWNPTGLQNVVDIVLHNVIPLAYVLFWFFFIPHGPLPWRSAFWWLCYPLAFALYNAFYSLWLPNAYPFLDVHAPEYIFIVLGLTLAFLLVGLLFIAIDRGLKPRGT